MNLNDPQTVNKTVISDQVTVIYYSWPTSQVMGVPLITVSLTGRRCHGGS